MRKGSGKAYLQTVALEIYKACLQHKIALRVTWKSRADPRMVLADEWSKHVDYDDWSVDDTTFEGASQIVGPFKCDLFASERNQRVDCFFSILIADSAVGRDAFTSDWYDWSPFFACLPPRKVGQ